MKILIAGGAGYIGSTIASICGENEIVPIILDNLSTGRIDFVNDRTFYRGDISDASLVQKVFDDHPDISVTIHCAAVLAVPDSVRHPLHYYRENVAKTLAFVEALIGAGCRRLIFSSSAAIYGSTPDFGVDETAPVKPATPYGWSKAMVERILHDCCRSKALSAVSMRYQNVIGADPHLRSGPTATGSARVLDKILDAALADRPFTITGTDWPTHDGTALRDYIHVWDLARAHLLALQTFDTLAATTAPDGYVALDLGTGSGTTVGELVRVAEAVLGRRVSVIRGPRRPGDTAGCYTRSRLARRHLGWQPQLSLDAAIRDVLRWREANAPCLPASAARAGP
jgi:UDP-glucose 4-epimerase